MTEPIRPGTEDLIARRGTAAAEAIIDSAEHHNDAAHTSWEESLRWAEATYDREKDGLTPEQIANNRAYEDLMERRPEAGREIFRTSIRLLVTDASLTGAEAIRRAEVEFDGGAVG